jgi:hypothetical protein
VTPVVFDKTRTADASGDGIDIKSAVRMSDAPRVASKADTTPSTSADPTNHVTVAEAKDTKTAVKTPAPIAAAKPVEATPSEEKSKQTEVAAKPDGESAKPDDTDPSAAKAEEPADTKTEAAKPNEAASPIKVAEMAATKVKPTKSETKVDASNAKGAPKADAHKSVAQTDPVKAEAARAEPAKTSEKPAQAADTPPSGPKDQTRVLPVTKQPKRREGQIAVFISRKDSKLYVRQNFAPLFEVPVTVAPSDRPLGTHIFTAEIDKNDSNILHWSVVTVPSRAATREQPRAIRIKKGKLAAPPVEAKPTPAVDSAAEALDRITIPADAMARIVEALTTGGSIIVSDQGINQGDTGEGTDFIVSLR